MRDARGAGHGEGLLLLRREMGSIMLAGFQEDRAGMEKGGDAREDGVLRFGLIHQSHECP